MKKKATFRFTLQTTAKLEIPIKIVGLFFFKTQFWNVHVALPPGTSHPLYFTCPNSHESDLQKLLQEVLCVYISKLHIKIFIYAYIHTIYINTYILVELITKLQIHIYMNI